MAKCEYLIAQDIQTNCAQPIFTEGDVIGCVAAVANEELYAARTERTALETEVKLIRTAAAFLGRQLES